MARAVAAADAAQQQVLALVGRADLTDDDVARVQQAIIDSGALADLEATITRLTAEAVAAIERAPIEPGARDELIALATYVSQRTV
jgi:geranylgeranyl diphosphate synthase type I